MRMRTRGLCLSVVLLASALGGAHLAYAQDPGGVFVTGHDPDFHAVSSNENAPGGQHIIQRAIAYVTGGNPSPRVLLVSDPEGCGGCRDPRNGLIAAGFSFDVADYGSGTPGVDDLNGVTFDQYDAIVVASDFGGWLRQRDLDVLIARSGEVIDYINRGGGVVAFAESGQIGTTSHDRFGFLPFLVSSTGFSQTESGITVTQPGAALGLSDGDVNGNYSHNIFTGTGGMDPIDVDRYGNILSLATKQFITPQGVALPTTKVADVSSTEVGSTGGYTITISNGSSIPVDLATVYDKLPDGFAYRSGSSSGATTEDPSITDGTLTWSGPITVPSQAAVSLHFEVTTSDIAGDYLNVAGGTAVDDQVAVLETEPTALITLTKKATTLRAEPAIAEILPGAQVNFPSLRARLTDSAYGSAPVAGRAVHFSAGGNELCLATTDATGWASCDGVAYELSAVLGLGYTASFGGDGTYEASSAKGSLVRVNGQNVP